MVRNPSKSYSKTTITGANQNEDSWLKRQQCTTQPRSTSRRFPEWLVVAKYDHSQTPRVEGRNLTCNKPGLDTVEGRSRRKEPKKTNPIPGEEDLLSSHHKFVVAWEDQISSRWVMISVISINRVFVYSLPSHCLITLTFNINQN